MQANLEQAYNVVLTVLNRLVFVAVWLHDLLILFYRTRYT